MFRLSFLILLSCILIPHSALMAEEQKTVGVILPLTGEAASYGEQFKDGLLANPLSSNLKIKFEDSRFENQQAISAFEKLIREDKIDYLISFGGATCQVLNSKAQKNKLVHLAAGCNTAPFIDSDSFNFRIDVNEEIGAGITARYLKSSGVSKVALLFINNSWGAKIIDHTRDALKKSGISISDELSFNTKDSGDLSSGLMKIKANKPDLIFMISLPNLTPEILSQLGVLGMRNIPIMSNISVENPEVVRLSGASADGIMYLAVADEPKSRSSYPLFYQLYPDGNPFAAWGYDAVTIINSAIKATEPRRYLHDLRGFIGAFNSYTFDRFGEIHFSYEIREIRNGKFVKKVNLTKF